MLTVEENDLLCRVENGAPMGKLMRQHWVPACLSEEVAENDGTPVRIRALGDNLVAFRDTKGRLGVLMRERIGTLHLSKISNSSKETVCNTRRTP